MSNIEALPAVWKNTVGLMEQMASLVEKNSFKTSVNRDMEVSNCKFLCCIQRYHILSRSINLKAILKPISKFACHMTCHITSRSLSGAGITGKLS